MATFIVNPYLMRRRLTNCVAGYLKPFVFNNSYLSSSNKSSATMKPPNVLVYQPKNAPFSPIDCNIMISLVEKSIPVNRYVVYGLQYPQAQKDPWMDNCQLLIIPSLNENIETCDHNNRTILPSEVILLQKYLSTGGKILNFSQQIMKHFGYQTIKASLYVTDCVYVSNDPSCAVEANVSDWNAEVFQMDEKLNHCKTALSAKYYNGTSDVVAILNRDGGGDLMHCTLPLLVTCDAESCQDVTGNSKVSIIKVLLRQLGFTENERAVLESAVRQGLPPCFVLSDDSISLRQFLSSAGIDVSKSCDVKGMAATLRVLKIEDFTAKTIESVKSDFSTYTPTLYCFNKDSPLPPIKFNWQKYCNHLSSKKFGKVVIYSDVVSSTMDIVEPFIGRMCQGSNFSICCIAQQQTNGKGRGGNKWLSPPGTAMFTLAFSIHIQSNLGQHLSILQHLMTVAVVDAVRSIPGLKDLDLRVKWPNDIYMGSDIKIGGVLVKSTIFKDHCIATIGCGVNVSNQIPTRCINDLIKAGKFSTEPLSCEEVLARSISRLEILIDMYQRDGPTLFLNLYYKYWIHSNQIVKIQDQPGVSSSVIDAKIVGIDNCGFLRVTVLGNPAQEISLQPDSNSFDMTKNLIAMRSSR